MKLTNKQLKRLIQEELRSVLEESWQTRGRNWLRQMNPFSGVRELGSQLTRGALEASIEGVVEESIEEFFNEEEGKTIQDMFLKGDEWSKEAALDYVKSLKGEDFAKEAKKHLESEQAKVDDERRRRQAKVDDERRRQHDINWDTLHDMLHKAWDWVKWKWEEDSLSQIRKLGKSMVPPVDDWDMERLEKRVKREIMKQHKEESAARRKSPENAYAQEAWADMHDPHHWRHDEDDY